MKTNREFVEAKLSFIQTCYSELLEVLEHSDEEIADSTILLRATERIIQLIVDEMLDVNKHIIMSENMGVTEDRQSTFYILSRNGVFSEDFALRIAPVVGLRNRLVHRYEKVDVHQLLTHIRKNHQDFKVYIKEVLNFISGGING